MRPSTVFIPPSQVLLCRKSTTVTVFLELRDKCVFFLPRYQSAVATIKDIDLLYWYKLQGDGLQSLRHGEGRKG